MRSAFTIATGPSAYKRMALNCARSFRRWNDLPFIIYTDEPLALPSSLRDVEVRVIRKGQYGRGFSTKLHLDKFAPTAKALFIDADCLVMGSLDPLYLAFDGAAVGVLGYLKADGDMFGDVASICEAVGVRSLPHFNGGIYYIESGHQSAQIFAEARRLEPYYDALGIIRLRGQPNDEMLIGIALAKANFVPVQNSGAYYADFQWWPEVTKVDALSGEARMRNPEVGKPGHQDRFPASDACPLIVHFLGHHVEGIHYRRETLALRLERCPQLARFAATTYSWPLEAGLMLKQWLRPAYHSLFGVRRIRRSKSRLIID